MTPPFIVQVRGEEDACIDMESLVSLCCDKFPPRSVVIDMVDREESGEEPEWFFIEDVDGCNLEDWIEQEFGFFDAEHAVLFKMLI